LAALAAALLLTSQPGLANPLKDQERWIGPEKVDLAPLFKWWSKRSGERPLVSWIHVTGSIVSTNTWSWVIEARIENSSNHGKNQPPATQQSNRIILKNPPVGEWAEFQNLTARQLWLNSQRQILSSRTNEAAERAQILSAQQKADRHEHVHPPPALAVEYKKWKQIQKEAEQRLKQIDQQIKDLKPRLAAYPDAESYVIDCFALKGGETFKDLPVYDYGKSMPVPPHR